jgi:hypothetical protein
LILVREINSGVSHLPARRDRLWVDFFPAPPPPLPDQPFAGGCRYPYLSDRFVGRVCPGMEGVSGDHLAAPLPFDYRFWNAKMPQDAGSITVRKGDFSSTLRQGLPNGLPFYPPDLPAGILSEGRVRVEASGGQRGN